MTVLVTGATGNVGSAVVRELRARGVAVRAFVRDRHRAAERLGDDVELALGDFSDAASVRRAVDGVDRVFLSSADGPQKVQHEATVVDACAAAGAALIVKASTLAADPRSPLPPLAWNGRSEDHLRRSGLPAAILASAFYMTNVLAAAEQIRRDGTLLAPAGDGRLAMIDPRDVGAVGAIVLTTGGHAGRRYVLTGPAAITYERAAHDLGRAIGAPVQFVDVPEDAARQGFVAAGMPAWLVEHLVGAFRLIRADTFAETTDTVRALTGRPARSFADFARDHAALFRRTVAPLPG
jgi:uncharacterized protein YbjT (DUF2867 family)